MPSVSNPPHEPVSVTTLPTELSPQSCPCYMGLLSQTKTLPPSCQPRLSAPSTLYRPHHTRYFTYTFSQHYFHVSKLRPGGNALPQFIQGASCGPGIRFRCPDARPPIADHPTRPRGRSHGIAHPSAQPPRSFPQQPQRVSPRSVTQAPRPTSPFMLCLTTANRS